MEGTWRNQTNRAKKDSFGNQTLFPKVKKTARYKIRQITTKAGNMLANKIEIMGRRKFNFEEILNIKQAIIINKGNESQKPEEQLQNNKQKSPE